jgi:hypothetical protein
MTKPASTPTCQAVSLLPATAKVKNSSKNAIIKPTTTIVPYRTTAVASLMLVVRTANPPIDGMALARNSKKVLLRTDGGSMFASLRIRSRSIRLNSMDRRETRGLRKTDKQDRKRLISSVKSC